MLLQENEVSHEGFPADSVTFTQKILNGKLHFFFADALFEI